MICLCSTKIKIKNARVTGPKRLALLGLRPIRRNGMEGGVDGPDLILMADQTMEVHPLPW